MYRHLACALHAIGFLEDDPAEAMMRRLRRMFGRAGLSSEEVTIGFGKRTAPKGVKVYSPAFDVTPAELITAIVCEKGIARPDFGESLAALVT